jgi:hypothetical protein
MGKREEEEQHVTNVRLFKKPDCLVINTSIITKILFLTERQARTGGRYRPFSLAMVAHFLL